jgi:superoxide dismutase
MRARRIEAFWKIVNWKFAEKTSSKRHTPV